MTTHNNGIAATAEELQSAQIARFAEELSGSLAILGTLNRKPDRLGTYIAEFF